MTDLCITDLGSLNFRDDWKTIEQVDNDYIQKFGPNDIISIQYAIAIEAPDQSQKTNPVLRDAEGNEISISIEFLTSNTDYIYYQIDIPTNELAPGCYRFAFEYYNYIVKAAFFEVLEDTEDTVLFRYTNERDDFDTLFRGSSFSFRCEGKFFPQNEEYLAETNDMRDQDHDLSQLSAQPYTQMTLTVGDKDGVPNWVADKLNRIFACTKVLLGEVSNDEINRYFTRVEGQGIERVILNEMNPLYLFKIKLERENDGVLSFDYATLPTVMPLLTENELQILTEDGLALLVEPF